MNTVLKARRAGEGLSVSYGVEQSRIWPAIEAALNWSSAERTSDHRNDGYLLVWFEGSNGNPRTFGGVWAEPAGEGASRVTVVTRRGAALRGSALSEEQFHRDLALAVRLLLEAKPFPLVRPE
jgi:hypothetical protein